MPTIKLNMLKQINIITLLLSGILACSFVRNVRATELDPFKYFNVYSLNAIGTFYDLYNTDIEGTTGAAGDVYLGLALGTKGLNEYALHSGGNAYIKGGSSNGDLDIGGDAEIRNIGLGAGVDINSGGNVDFKDGSMQGILNAAGDINVQNAYVPNRNSGVAYTPLFDYLALNDYFLGTSSTIGALSATGEGTAPYTTMYFNASSGINVFDINATTLYDSIKHIIITGPADAIVYLNASDVEADLGWSLNWDYEGGISAHNVVLNFPDAQRLTLSGGEINILAPLADTYFTSGALTGNLITGNLYGGAQVNYGYSHFTPATATEPVPEPATIFLMAGGLIGLVGCRKKLRNKTI